uniref:F-box/FBD/LRR-repeat protein At1g13570-like n=1 Tax=Erigeron canadensis TaxID=72917 RepID=UPI001CB8CE72|nr:F-box/FBD/LRR-repeat protein At1g13570-like [Erigeron canadensis]
MKARRRSSNLDRISALPQPIIENILCHLPIQDAVRTSVVSRDWRYTWTKIPQLAFSEFQFKASTDDNKLSALEKTFGVTSQRRNMTKRCKLFYGIYHVLLTRQGPVDVFTLCMKADKSCVELDQIIHHLSRSSNNTLKKLTLYLNSSSGSGYKLPLSFFSLKRLTHLTLDGCHLDDQPTFKGFPSLTTLSLDDVNTSKSMLIHLVSSCPLIKRFTLIIDDENIIGDDDDDDANITKLLDCLHVIEHLCISHSAIQCFEDRGVPQELPSALVHLKFFCFVDISFIAKCGLLFVGLVIRNSPNLEKLRLTVSQYPFLEKSKIEPINLQDYSDIWLEHLKELEIEDFVNLEHLLEFVKLILTKSPVLKKVSIFLYYEVTTDEEMMVLRILLCSPRASPHAKIFVERRPIK